jgi:hypothetical protein
LATGVFAGLAVGERPCQSSHLGRPLAVVLALAGLLAGRPDVSDAQLRALPGEISIEQLHASEAARS